MLAPGLSVNLCSIHCIMTNFTKSKQTSYAGKSLDLPVLGHKRTYVFLLLHTLCILRLSYLSHIVNLKKIFLTVNSNVLGVNLASHM